MNLTYSESQCSKSYFFSQMNNNRALVEFAALRNIQSPNNGGVLSIGQTTIYIICCTFYNDSTQEMGGCIYGNNSRINIEKTTFSNCYSTKNDGLHGNVAFIEGDQVHISNCETYLCGCDTTKCSDSSIHIENSYNEITNYNASTNYGVRGASGFSIHSALEDSIAKYCNIIDSHDYMFVESLTKPYSIYNTNFIKANNDNNYIIYVASSNILTVVNCVFIEMNQKRLVYSNYIVTFINCTSDNTLSPNTYEIENKNNEDIKCNDIDIDIMQCQYKEMNAKTCHKEKKYHYFLFLFVLCFIKK